MSHTSLLRVGALAVVVCTFASVAHAATLGLQWDANTETDIAGYVVRYGTITGNYTASVDIGNQTSAHIPNLVSGTQYFAVVEAYNTAGLHSAISAEVSRVVFDAVSVAVTLNVAGVGQGQVTAAGTWCRGTCTVSGTAGTTLALSAVSNVDSVFVGWEGAGCAAGTLNLTTTPMTCTARFAPLSATANFDANGDGRADILAYNPTDGTVRVMLTSSNGGWATTTYQASWPMEWIVRAGDFNGDGATDLLGFDPLTGAWQLAAGDKLGHFTVTQSAVFSPAANVYAVDLNRDGRSDLFLHDPATGRWQKCLSGTAGFVCEAGAWSPGWAVYPVRAQNPVAGDLVIYNRTTGVAELAINNPAGGFTLVPATVGAGWDVYPADFDGNGNADLLLYNPTSGRWSVCLNTTTGFACQTGQWAAGWVPTPLRADGDGKTQVLLYNPISQATAVARFTGTSFSVTTIPSASQYLLFRPADFNGDGRDDLLMLQPAYGSIAETINVGLNRFQVYRVATLPGSSATAQR